MFENDRKETASKAVTSIRLRNDIEKSTWKTHRYFVGFENRIHVEYFTSNRCHNFNVDLTFKIDEISTNFPRGVSALNRWWIEEDVPIGWNLWHQTNLYLKKKENIWTPSRYFPFLVSFFCWNETNKSSIKEDTRKIENCKINHIFDRSSHRKCCVKKVVLRNFAKFTVRHLC